MQKFILLKNKILGFTLAEVLITLSIVGTISALTIPSVVKNYHNSMYVAQLKKVIGQLDYAVTGYLQDDITADFTKSSLVKKSGDTELKNFLDDKYMPIAKNCELKGDDACFLSGDEYYYYNNNKKEASKFGQSNYTKCVLTTNGAVVCIKKYNLNSAPNIFLIVDTNGPDGPNTTGFDIYTLKMNKDNGSIEDGFSQKNYCGRSSHSGLGGIGSYAGGCLTKLIQNGWKIK